MVWLLEASNETKKSNYAHIVEAVLGKKAGIILNIVFIMVCFSLVTLYFIVTADFLPLILEEFGVSQEILSNPYTRVVGCVGTALFVFPFGIQRNLTSI